MINLILPTNLEQNCSEGLKMNQLEEKTISITFTVAGYDLGVIDFNELHNDLMCDVSDRLAMFAIVGNFQSNVTTKKVKL